MGKFTTDMRAYDREIGDVITLSDVLMGYSSKLVKITSIIDSGDGLLDIFWREYDANLYTDELGDLNPVVTATTALNVNAYPGDVSSFSAKILLSSILFTWTAAKNPNAKYEIREGTSWKASQLIATDITGTSYSTQLFGSGSKTFYIKAISEYGVYSQNEASDSFSVSDIFLRNIVLSTDLTSGTPSNTNCSIYGSLITPDPTIDWSDESPDLWSTVETNYYVVDEKWGCDGVETSSSSESDEIDVGADLESLCYVTYDFDMCGDDDNTVTFQWKYKTAAGSYQDDWVEFSPGTYEFRYCKFKIVLSNPNGIMSNLESPTINVDVPDRLEFYNDISIAAGGTTITFATHPQSKIAKPFTTTPAVNVTPEDDSITLTPVWKTKSATAVTVYLYDKNDTAVTGTADITVKGY
jgi:hypothetical protein